MNLRFLFTLLASLLCATARCADIKWPGPSLHPFTERIVRHIPAGYDPDKVIPIILCPDIKYLPHSGVTVTSILDNANPEYAYDVYILYNRTLSLPQKRLWLDLGKQYAGSVKFNITFVDGRSLIDTAKVSGGVWGITVLYRLVAPEMDTFAQYDKLIYIDCDMIVYDLIPFWTQSFDLPSGNEAWLVAIRDIMTINPQACAYAEANLIKRTPQLAEEPDFTCKDYINSGLLLMNLPALRRNEFAAKTLEFVQTKDPIWVTQDPINSLFFKNIKRLEFKYAYPFMLTKSKPDDIYVLHYVDKPKPWHMRLPSDPDLISSLSDYHFYRQKSPWKFQPAIQKPALMNPSQIARVLRSKIPRE